MKTLSIYIFSILLSATTMGQQEKTNLPAAAAENIVNVRLLAANVSANHDYAETINKAIASLPESGGVIYFPTGTYLVNTPVIITKPVHFIGDGIQRYSDSKGYDYEAGTKIITRSGAGITVFECSISGSKTSSFQGSTFEGIGFKDEGNKASHNTILALNMINNFRIVNCSFSGAGKAIVVDAGTEDASWGEIQNCIFSFNDTAIENKTSQGSVPNLHVSGGMFVVGKNQCGIVNRNGQYVRLEGFKMDILGDHATGILWAGGTKGSISDVGMELNNNGVETHGITIIPQSRKLNNTILDLSLLSLNMTSDGTCGAMIKIEGKSASFPVNGIKIIGCGFSGGTVGIQLGSFTANNLISGCSFHGFSKSTIAIGNNSHANLLTDILSDKPSSGAGGIDDQSSSTMYNGYHWVDGGDRGMKGIRPVLLTEPERDAIKDPKPGELIFNKTAVQYEFYNGDEWAPLSYSTWAIGNDGVISYSKGNVLIGNKIKTSKSALLELNSRTKGLLVPRMTTKEKRNIDNPPEGLVVYDLDLHRLSVYNGSKWE